ncbi:MAG TPA: flagellar cap protein FliD N-terminal domain-containing protein, partial [Vicinamibacterales bacterium]|nr:flagellar cap protein FliD N-terminal domain-containing protein [Vicinamibacterales bacterium]
MGSPVTLSGFNNIDFNLILTSIMTQESQPLVALQSRQASLQSKASAFGSLANRVSALQSAVAKLSSATNLASTKATTSDPA